MLENIVLVQAWWKGPDRKPGFPRPQQIVETDVLLIFSRSETARIDNPCSNVSRSIDRMSFTSVCLACFRLGIMSSLKTRGQSARSALTKIDLNPSLYLSAT